MSRGMTDTSPRDVKQKSVFLRPALYLFLVTVVGIIAMVSAFKMGR